MMRAKRPLPKQGLNVSGPVDNSKHFDPIFQRTIEDEMPIEFPHQAHSNAFQKGVPKIPGSSHSGLGSNESERFFRSPIESERRVGCGMLGKIFCLLVQIADGFGPNNDLPLHRRPFL